MGAPVSSGTTTMWRTVRSAGTGTGERPLRSHDRWVINKIRALGSYYTKGLDNGSHLRTAVNTAESLDALRDLIAEFFFVQAAPVA